MEKFLTTIFISLLSFVLYGQVETRYFPDGDALGKLEQIGIDQIMGKTKTISMPWFDVDKLIEEDLKSEDINTPYRFGYGFDVDIDLSDGSWVNVQNGNLWSLSFHSNGANSLNFIFNKLSLPKGSELYIVNADHSAIYGPVTEKQNINDGLFLTTLIPGATVTIYLFIPNMGETEPTISISKVVHGYRNYGYYGASNNSCQNNINCYPAWATESNAVGMILLADGTAWGSGALLMTTDYSFKPYFLTAFHCVDRINPYGQLSNSEKTAVQNWVIVFNFKQSSCYGSTLTNTIGYSGASFRAGWADSDFALIELTQPLLGNKNFSWLGWN